MKKFLKRLALRWAAPELAHAVENAPAWRDVSYLETCRNFFIGDECVGFRFVDKDLFTFEFCPANWAGEYNMSRYNMSRRPATYRQQGAVRRLVEHGTKD